MWWWSVREEHSRRPIAMGLHTLHCRFPKTSNHLDDPDTQGFVRPLIRDYCTLYGHLVQLNFNFSSRFRMTWPPSTPRAVSKNWYATPLNHGMGIPLTIET